VLYIFFQTAMQLNW